LWKDADKTRANPNTVTTPLSTAPEQREVLMSSKRRRKKKGRRNHPANHGKRPQC